MSEPTPAPAPAAPAPTPAPTPAPAPSPTPAPAPAPTPEPAPQPSGDGLPDDPGALKAMIADLRKENGAARTNAKQQAAQQARDELAQQIGKALGLVKDDETPDPAQLTEQLTQTQQQAKQSAVELAVYKAAGKHHGDPDALLDSRAFLQKVQGLDPAADDFATQVDQAIADAVAANPKLKVTQAVPRSGAESPGGSGGGVTPEQFARMTAAERNDLFTTNPTLYRQLAGR